MRKSLNFVRGLRDCRRGSTAIEYALIASLVAAGLVASIYSVGQSVNHQFTNTADAVQKAS